jgi:hemoglobin-like flavoprotein
MNGEIRFYLSESIFSMFESRPELIKTFSKFKGKDLYTLQESGLLQQHALRVMATIDKCITYINQPSSMIQILREVGHLHTVYNVKPDDIQVK